MNENKKIIQVFTEIIGKAIKLRTEFFRVFRSKKISYEFLNTFGLPRLIYESISCKTFSFGHPNSGKVQRYDMPSIWSLISVSKLLTALPTSSWMLKNFCLETLKQKLQCNHAYGLRQIQLTNFEPWDYAYFKYSDWFPQVYTKYSSILR